MGSRMIAGLKLLFIHRRILWATTLNDIRARYKGTILGLTWPILYPLLFLGLYAVVYSLIFKIRMEGVTAFGYVLMIFSGLIPFLGLAEALGSGVGSVLSNTNLIKNTMFLFLNPLRYGNNAISWTRDRLIHHRLHMQCGGKNI